MRGVRARLHSLAIGVLTVVLTSGCQHDPQVRAPLGDASTYPFTLLPPNRTKQKFMVRQNVSIVLDAGGTSHRGSIDVVLQKQEDSLLLVGLGPMNTRAFVIEYRDGVVRYERANASVPELPIAPRALVVDVERVYLASLPVPAEDFTGTLTGTLHDEQVTERWQQGSLRTRTFTRKGFAAPIVVEFGPGYTTKTTDPHRVILRNPWLGYEATIAGEDAETIE